MPFLSSAGLQYSYLAPSVLPEPIYFPADTIVPYYGASDPGYTNWTSYTTGANTVIMGTTNSSIVGLTSTGNAATWSASLNSTGAHTGTTYTSSSSSTAGSGWRDAGVSAGAHGHSINITYSSLKPKSAYVRLLRSTTQVTSLPPNTIAFRNSALGAYGSRFNPSTSGANTVYFRNATTGTGVIEEAVSSQTNSGSSTTAGAHIHNSLTRNVITGSGFPSSVTAGNHTHSLSVTVTQSILQSTKILHAWISATNRIAATDVVVMYVGDIASLPAGWYLCNGLNGTIDMNSYYLAYSTDNNTVWETVRNNNATAVSPPTTTTPFTTSHAHNTGVAAGGGIAQQHSSYSWSHTHTLSGATVTPATSNRIFLYFIQYKGV